MVTKFYIMEDEEDYKECVSFLKKKNIKFSNSRTFESIIPSFNENQQVIFYDGKGLTYCNLNWTKKVAVNSSAYKQVDDIKKLVNENTKKQKQLAW